MLTIACLLMSGGHGYSHKFAEVDLGSVLESELGQKWRYGALKVCSSEK